MITAALLLGLLLLAVPSPSSGAALFQGPAQGTSDAGAIQTTDSFGPADLPPPGSEDLRAVPIGRTPRIPVGPGPAAPLAAEGANEQEDPAPPAAAPDAAPAPGAPALLTDFQGIAQTSSIPPDPHVAAGPNHLIAAVNRSFAIFTKSGTKLKQISAPTWFDNVLSGNNAFDPKVVYDHFAGRWVIVYLAKNGTTSSHILVSVSDDSDPTGGWCNWAIRGDRNGSTVTDNWSDYQGVGFDDSAVYIVPNQFGFSDNAFDYAKIRILPKTALYNTSCPAVTFTDFWDLRDPDTTTQPTFTTRPAVTFGTPGTEYFVGASPFGTAMTLWKLTNPLAASPALTAVNVPVTAFSSPPDADQSGGSAGGLYIDAGGGRVRNAVYRGGSLWTAHSVAGGSCPATSGTAVCSRARYVRIDVTTNAALEDISFGADDCWLYYPAVTADANDNMVMVYNQSCTDTFAGIRYTGRKAADTALQASAELKAGEANYVKDFGSGSNRWGDYNGIAVDPADATKVWVFSEYATTPANTWNTWIGQVTFGTSPVANAQNLATDEDTPLGITLTGTDPEGDPLTFAVATQPANGALTGTPPDLTYTPDADFNGSDGFTFTANDGTTTSASATVSITVNPVNDPPVADAQSVTTDEDAAVGVTLTGSDIDGDGLTFAVATQPAKGTLSGTAPNLTYTPDADANGSDSFTFTANDGTAASSAATVSITINPVDDAPVADAQSVTTDEDTAVSVTLTGSDADGDSLTFAVATQPANGALTGTAPDLTYTPKANFNGTDSFTFTVSDGTATSSAAAVSITVDPVDDPPLAFAQRVTGLQDTLITIRLTGADPDGDAITQFTIETSPANLSSFGGTAAATACAFGGSCNFLPDAGFSGTDSLTFTVTSVDSATSAATKSPPATVKIRILPAGGVTAPLAHPQQVSTGQDTPLPVTLTGFDPEGDALSFSVKNGPSNGTLTGAAPDLTYTPDAGFSGSDIFTFTASDGTSASGPAAVSITVIPADRTPAVDSTSPASGPAAGGTTVTIRGRNFVSGTAVTFGGVAAADARPAPKVTVTNSTTLTAVTPAGAEGTVDVVVTTPEGSATAHGGFTYLDDTAPNPQAIPFASVLPTSRSVEVGKTATAFVTVLNGGTAALRRVTLALKEDLPALFLYQTTDPSTNAVTRSVNAPVDIAPGASQSFVVALTPTESFGATEVEFVFQGLNSGAVTRITGVNTLLLSASPSPTPDVVALAATTTNDGIIHVPGAGQAGAFAAATVNVGASASITASADDGGAGLPVEISICETDPSSGQCISPIGSSVATTISANATPTFGIFVKANEAIGLDPATKRVFVRFKDSSGVTRGSTSVAVRTQ